MDAKASTNLFPPTRYQGSKYKLLSWIGEHTNNLKFDSVLDVFSGTAAVSYLFKTMGKRVVSNDYLKCNQIMAKALVENNETKLPLEKTQALIKKNNAREYSDVIQKHFADIYYTDEENQWLDIVACNIQEMTNVFERAIAYYALFQACLIKRPYNLFHRKNLYVRTAKVKRTFGNKKTWDRSFDEYFVRFVTEANNAVIYSDKPAKTLQCDALKIPELRADLVYIDPPYCPADGPGVDYLSFYHFLDGLTDYDLWLQKIDFSRKHKPLQGALSVWSQPKTITDAFQALFAKYAKSILVISYRDEGVPSVQTLTGILEGQGKKVFVHKQPYQYVLSKKRIQEVLIIAV